jgi:hypothetical protein
VIEKLISVYVLLFRRARYQKLNKLLYRLSLSGLGIMNYSTSKVSGEKAFLEKYLANKRGILLNVGANQGNYTLRSAWGQLGFKSLCF